MLVNKARPGCKTVLQHSGGEAFRWSSRGGSPKAERSEPGYPSKRHKDQASAMSGTQNQVGPDSNLSETMFNQPAHEHLGADGAVTKLESSASKHEIRRVVEYDDIVLSKKKPIEAIRVNTQSSSKMIKIRSNRNPEQDHFLGDTEYRGEQHASGEQAAATGMHEHVKRHSSRNSAARHPSEAFYDNDSLSPPKEAAGGFLSSHDKESALRRSKLGVLGVAISSNKANFKS